VSRARPRQLGVPPPTPVRCTCAPVQRRRCVER
jgi:hypothetical protein